MIKPSRLLRRAFNQDGEPIGYLKSYCVTDPSLLSLSLAATTQYMLDYAETAPTAGVSYTYDCSAGTGKLGSVDNADITEKDISKWTIKTTSNSKNLGDATATSWIVVLDKEENVSGYKATWPSAKTGE